MTRISSSVGANGFVAKIDTGLQAVESSERRVRPSEVAANARSEFLNSRGDPDQRADGDDRVSSVYPVGEDYVRERRADRSPKTDGTMDDPQPTSARVPPRTPRPHRG